MRVPSNAISIAKEARNACFLLRPVTAFYPSHVSLDELHERGGGMAWHRYIVPIPALLAYTLAGPSVVVGHMAATAMITTIIRRRRLKATDRDFCYHMKSATAACGPPRGRPSRGGMGEREVCAREGACKIRERLRRSRNSRACAENLSLRVSCMRVYVSP